VLGAINPDWPSDAPVAPIQLDSRFTHASFDNHLKQLKPSETNRGEFADISLHDRVNGVLVGIEAKVRSNWTHSKDVQQNLERLSGAADALGAKAVPVLLITQSKWRGVQEQRHRSSSQLRRLEENRGTRVITWERLLPICEGTPVEAYLRWILSRP
jgi:hypothetical protein